MFEAIKKLNENAGSLAIVLTVVGLLLNITWQIGEVRQGGVDGRKAISEDIHEVEQKLSGDIHEVEQKLSGDIHEVEQKLSGVEVKLSKDINEGRLETNTEISGLRERVGALEVLVRGAAPQESTHTNASAEPSTAREPSPEASDQPRTSALP